MGFLKGLQLAAQAFDKEAKVTERIMDAKAQGKVLSGAAKSAFSLFKEQINAAKPPRHIDGSGKLI